MIRVSHLRVDYDDLRAVDDLSLEVGPGEVCGLIGPNGAGKTTTMRALLGLVEPTDGRVELAGVDVSERPRDALARVGFMPDSVPLYDDLKVWEFLDLFAASYAMPRALRRAAIDEHLERVGLAEKRQAMIRTLSRGMRQRVALARLLIPDPDVLLLDEPANGMDPQGRIDLKNVLKAQRALGKAVLISSHILAEMSDFCTSVAIMERGRLVISGAIAEVSARVMDGMTIAVEVLGDPAPFLDLVAADPLAGLPERRDGRFAVPYRGNPSQASELLATLVRGGVRVAAFAPTRGNLEELFQKVGAKELS